MYFFLYYTAALNINANIDTYKVTLYSKKTAQTFDYNCIQKNCSLADIPPFEYTVTLSSTGYKDIVESFVLRARKTQKIVGSFEKQIRLKKIEEIKITPGAIAQQKIETLRKQKSSYAVFILSTGEEISVQELPAELVLFYRDIELFRFEKVEASAIQIEEVQGGDSIYIRAGSKQGILDTNSYSFSPLVFTPKISYIKLGSSSQQLIFVSDKGAFTYDIGSNTFLYFYAFLDYIVFEKEYIGVIYADEKQKKKNYNLESETQNLIIRYNPDSKSRKILYKTALKIQKIYRKGERIFFEADGETYELENFE